MPAQILVINPGSTSTKVAFYENDQVRWEENIQYMPQDFSAYSSINDQIEHRLSDIEKLLSDKHITNDQLSAIASRGGPFRPMAGGTYRINERLIRDIETGHVMAEHASNLGALIAWRLSCQGKVPAYFTDPVCVDEFEPPARYSGMPELERKSLGHALSIKAAARKSSEKLGLSLQSSCFVVAHLGGGISIASVRNGRIIDLNNANEEGPFSPERCGTLPVNALTKLCYSDQFTYQEMKKKLVGQGGLVAYLGTSDFQEIERRIEQGDEKAKELVQAMAYHIAKFIGAYAAVLGRRPDAIVITGGLAKSQLIVEWIKERVSFIAQLIVIQENLEMEALASAALRVINHQETALEYPV